MLAYEVNGLMLGSGAHGDLLVLDKFGLGIPPIARHEHEFQAGFTSGCPLFLYCIYQIL